MDGQAARHQRLRGALRANLKRRKVQARARSVTDGGAAEPREPTSTEMHDPTSDAGETPAGSGRAG